ncbi:MAG: hypothetical protein PVI50_01145 [Gammaproteobacteria bacterium]|jgi:hypothetical protein
MRTAGRVLLLNLLFAVLLVGLVELVYSSLAWLFVTPGNIWIFEDIGRTVRFDPVRGYTLTRTPARFARIIDGDIEYVGTFRGNAQGMPDRDDFTPERPPGIARRYAVFGDSYSSAQYLAINWPDRTEDLLMAAGAPIELLNFSTHGAGLANWVSNLEGILAQDNYLVDGLIFAVFGDDLRRRFTLADGRDRERFSFGHVEGWNPAGYPQTRAEAGELLASHEISTAYILSSSEFDAALTGDWEPERFWEFKVLNAAAFHGSRLWQAVHRHFAVRPGPRPAKSHFGQGQLRHIDAIRDYAAARDLPVWVIHIPDLEQAAGKAEPGYAASREFARRLAAVFIDGRQAFAGFPPEALPDLWFEHDKHWNQAGSNAFAGFMAEHLLRRAAAGGTQATAPSIR